MEGRELVLKLRKDTWFHSQTPWDFYRVNSVTEDLHLYFSCTSLPTWDRTPTPSRCFTLSLQGRRPSVLLLFSFPQVSPPVPYRLVGSSPVTYFSTSRRPGSNTPNFTYPLDRFVHPVPLSTLNFCDPNPQFSCRD